MNSLEKKSKIKRHVKQHVLQSMKARMAKLLNLIQIFKKMIVMKA
jgi:hypothetical protein